ncbi:MAG: hypothetical protein HON47_01870 [Candidatus Diapherotrites archaeon]|jgi:hypothetical protein|uniref:Glycerophosphoryl diester phosphodiesterase membrane domain-containing protein n=1 Tax=Candidatus Iainarchaeum sp. TaxID=3101447 RepID=A0A8T5GDU5_9ARCH|nr:hypothetical protein [Candidatus Diapherotrites archaeon]MBT7241448.1 hypothetical protein [Candidatus Diapherotrites archaeon]
MDYDRIINFTYNWFSLSKLAWFLIFFWLAIPLLFLVPWAIEKQYFDGSVYWIVYIFYIIIYFGIMLGFATLTSACLGHRKLKHQISTSTRFLDTIILAVLELWYIFVWNIHKSHRFTQLLVLLGTPLLYFYYLFNPTVLILASFVIFAILYLLFVIHNSVRLFFTVTIFYNKDISKKEAIRDAWELTKGRFILTFFGIALVVGVVFVMFAVMAIILGAIAHIILLPHFTPLVAYELARAVAIIFALGPAIISYYFGIIEVYNQLDKERVSNSRIKRILTKRILSPKRKVTKKVKKKKVVRKRAVKKKKVKKKVIKKKGKKKK